MQAKGTAPNSHGVSAAIAACGAALQLPQAIQLLEQADTRYGVPPDEACYNAAIAAAEKCGQVETALALAQRMRGAGLDATSITYSTLITALGNAGRCQEAVAKLREMELMSTPKDMSVYSATIAACGRAGEWRYALELLAEAEERVRLPLDISSATATVQACAAACQLEPCFELLKRLGASKRLARDSYVAAKRTGSGAALCRSSRAAFLTRQVRGTPHCTAGVPQGGRPSRGARAGVDRATRARSNRTRGDCYRAWRTAQAREWPYRAVTGRCGCNLPREARL